jgi:hypothetical protein
MSLLIEQSWPLYLILTCVLGGGAAFMTGRSLALAWRPWWQLAAAVLLLGAAVRFLDYALFAGQLLSLHYYLTDTLTLALAAAAGFRLTRAEQMVTRYHWLYRRTGPFSWTDKGTQ